MGLECLVHVDEVQPKYYATNRFYKLQFMLAICFNMPESERWLHPWLSLDVNRVVRHRKRGDNRLWNTRLMSRYMFGSDFTWVIFSNMAAHSKALVDAMLKEFQAATKRPEEFLGWVSPSFTTHVRKQDTSGNATGDWPVAGKYLESFELLLQRSQNWRFNTR